MMRMTVGIFLALIVAALLLSPVVAAEPEDAKLAAVFNKYLDEEFRHRPMEATRQGDHRFDHLLDDLSPKARAAGIDRIRQALRELPAQVEYARLSRSGQIDFEILKHDLTRGLWLAENTRPFEHDPRTYNEYISDSTFLLLTQSTEPKATNIKNCVAPLAFITRVVAT